MSVTIFHNPRCSKSRATLALLTERGLEPTIIEYLKQPPDVETIRTILTSSGLPPMAHVRTGEDEFRASGLSADETDVAVIAAAIAAAPRLLERPVVVVGDQARIGRPPENVLELL
jgi:arsenate reductase